MLPRLLGRSAAAAASATASPMTQAQPLSTARTLLAAPEKVECFIDGKKVLVDPGTTVLQVKDKEFAYYEP